MSTRTIGTPVLTVDTADLNEWASTFATENHIEDAESFVDMVTRIYEDMDDDAGAIILFPGLDENKHDMVTIRDLSNGYNDSPYRVTVPFKEPIVILLVDGDFSELDVLNP